MIKKLHKNLFILLAVIGVGSLQLSAQIVGNVENFNGSLNGWATGFGTSTVTYADAAASGTVDGALKMLRADNNANFGLKLAGTTPIGVNASTYKIIKLRYKNGTKANQIRIGGTNGSGAAIKTSTGADINFNVMTPDPGVNTNGYVTTYIDMTSYETWTGDLQYFWIGIRQNYVASPVEGDFYLDKIEFIESLPPLTFNEFIKNPGFEDIANGLAHFTGTSTDATRELTTTEMHDGDQSLKYTYTSDATNNFWAFSSYEGDYAASPKLAGTVAVVKMWVKTNRTTPITMQARLKLSNLDVENTTKPMVSVNTTKTDGSWEELTFNIPCPENFDGVTLWFNLLYDVATPNENLKAGDIVYVDQLSATFDYSLLSVKENTLKGVAVYPNPVSDVLNISAPEGSLVKIYNSLGVVVKTVNGTNSVSVSDLAAGLYVVKITKDGKFYQNKLVIK